mmetsp:Transcript_8451/g.12241  ORF Transcript_8451/g.12241 Transcript_8451/m.12241 type:complete len:119 (+) Transcript_8451:127-483(+)|eukprot:CAMPEP_0194200644 /NCGR_PEP_ID=MMETSP0156-20130528/1158_1 /TAXON_ID=33649 /ORGANISM="Thalassionema nitzschioides, Strain L26-B" /LENGTH=118 /DNA_ID=CAMNT_0038925663 /DNA_START=111 /DNA_END=467 /DNA_ORIENTATION=-
MVKILYTILFITAAASGFQTMMVSRHTSVSLQSHPHLSGANSEEDATYLLAKAKECAYSDYGFSVEDAKMFLRELMHVQSGCVVGTLVGRELCDDQEQVAKIVSKLRKKIEKEQVPSS